MTLPRSIEVHGHRGSRGTLPENTIPAFQEALAAGADYFELDIHLSSDAIPVVFHDPSLDGKPVQRMTAAELQARDVGAVANPKFPRQKAVPGTHPPTLDETLAWLAGASSSLGVNIEMKIESVAPDPLPDPVKFTRLTLELVKKHGLVRRTLFQSFDFRPLREAKRLIPELRLSCLFEKSADFASEAVAVGAQAVGPFFRLLDERIIADCHARGLKVIPWTVNEPADWEWLLKIGVDGIITDYPRDLVTFLSDRKARR